MQVKSCRIEYPRKRVVDDLQCRNKDNLTVIAGEYYGSMFTYAETGSMSGVSDKLTENAYDVTVSPVPGVMYSIEAPGMKYLLGVSFISQFKTNPITSKRDVYGLPNEIKFVYALDEGATHVIKRDVNGKQTSVNSNEMTLV